MKSLSAAFLLTFALLFVACDSNDSNATNPEEEIFDEDEPECATVTFEFVPGEELSEGLVINSQFEDLLGMTFSLEDGTDPVLAKTGAPSTAFEPNDSPNNGQGVGDFFLTDDGLITADLSPLIVTFTAPVDSASGLVLDIDGGETFNIQAFDSSNNMLEDFVITDGDPGTGSRIATTWFFSRDTPDVASIRFEGQRPSGIFGLGFDNFTTCAPSRLP